MQLTVRAYMDTPRARQTPESGADRSDAPIAAETTAPPATEPSRVPGTAPVTEPATAPPGPRSILLRRLGTAARMVALAVAGFVMLVVALLALYRFVDPPFTTLTAARWIVREPVDQRWVPLARISPQ